MRRRYRSGALVVLLTLVGGSSPAANAGAADDALNRLKEQRRQFQDQALTTSKSLGLIFNPGDPPRIIWRDVDEVRRLGSDGRLRVRWFDTDLNQSDRPAKPGRWVASVEGTAPNGSPVRRSLTGYARPPGFLLFFFPPQELSVTLPPKSGTIAPQVWDEHQAEVASLPRDLLFRALNDDADSVRLLAGLADCKPLGRPARTTESAAVLDQDLHLALKLKVQGLAGKVRSLEPPRRRDTPAPVLREGSVAEAGMKPDAAATIRAICRAWADDSKEPFVTLVARNGVIVVHEPFGRDASGQPVGLDYRGDVFSITKSITGLLFSQFLDQGLLALDDPVGRIFPDYPRDPAHVPTFRQCFTHTSGLSGHGDWGGVRNPNFENVVLNGIDANRAGTTYEYSGNGFELAAKAMEVVTGKSAPHLYQDHLFGPLGLGDVPVDLASSGMRFTARELAVLAQWLANRGSYGDREFIRPATFETLLPEPLGRHCPGVTEEEGIGMHWLRHLQTGLPAGSTRPQDLIFSPHTVGHGSFSACIFLVDLDTGLVITQIRKTGGPRYGEWSQRFFQAVADGLAPGNSH